MDSSGSSFLDDDYDKYPAHTRLPNEQVLDLYAELTHQGEYDLLPYEKDWKARRPYLESKGYELRPRYTEDWWPSWIGTDINPFFCEDSIESSVRSFIFHFHFHLYFGPSFSQGAPGRSAERIRIRITHYAYHIAYRWRLRFKRCCFNLVRRYKAYIPTLSPCFRIRPVAPPTKRRRNAAVLIGVLRVVHGSNGLRSHSLSINSSRDRSQP